MFMIGRFYCATSIMMKVFLCGFKIYNCIISFFIVFCLQPLLLEKKIDNVLLFYQFL